MEAESLRNRIVKMKSLTVALAQPNGVQAQVLDHPLARAQRAADAVRQSWNLHVEPAGCCCRCCVKCRRSAQPFRSRESGKERGRRVCCPVSRHPAPPRTDLLCLLGGAASGASAESSRARKAQAASSGLRHCGLCGDAFKCRNFTRLRHCAYWIRARERRFRATSVCVRARSVLCSSRIWRV